MKVLIILALTVAVASAGFSGSFSNQAKPLLSQAISKIQADLAIHSPARNSAEAGFQTEFVNALHNQATDVINIIDNTVNHVQTIAQTVVSSFHAAIGQLQAVGANVIENGQNILSNLWSNIIGSIFGNKNSRALSPALAAIVAQVASNPDFVALVHNSDSYKCLAAQGLVITLQWLQEQNAAGHLNAALLENPAIAKCVEQAGGLTALISGSEIVDWVQNLASNLGLSGMIHQIIIDICGEDLGYLIVDALQSRGMFSDVWSSISGAASNAWSSLSNSVASVGQYIASVASQAWTSAQEKFEMIKQLAMAFIQGGITTAQLATQEAAQEFVNFMAPYHTDLGHLYTQVIAQITGIWDGIQLPTWQS